MAEPDRLAYALTHPLTDPGTDNIEAYRHIEEQPDGNLLLTVLAVDR